MELVKASSGMRLERQAALQQLQDVGNRLEHLLIRFGRLVSTAGRPGPPPADLGGCLDLVNTELGRLTLRLQELIIQDHESARGVTVPAGQAAAGRRNAAQRRIERTA
jgi:hypothetical protein